MTVLMAALRSQASLPPLDYLCLENAGSLLKLIHGHPRLESRIQVLFIGFIMEDFQTQGFSTSPAGSLEPFDDILRQPGYLESQEDVRCLILNTAQTVAPSREGSPSLAQDLGRRSTSAQQLEAQAQLTAALSSGRKVEYLKNWVAEVAPWVGLSAALHSYLINFIDHSSVA